MSLPELQIGRRVCLMSSVTSDAKAAKVSKKQSNSTDPLRQLNCDCVTSHEVDYNQVMIARGKALI